MILKARCQHCGKHFEYDPADYENHDTAACPTCNNATPLVPVRDSKPVIPVRTMHPGDNYLRNLRDRSRYKGLRQLIDVVFMLTLVGGMAFTLICWEINNQDASTTAQMIVFVSIVATAVILIIQRLFAIMIIDAVDSLLEHHSKN